MLIVSNGMPKSGTSLFFHYTKQLLASQCPSQGQLKISELVRAGELQGTGDFVGNLDDRSLEILCELARKSGPLVVKTHAPQSPLLNSLLDEGALKVTFGHRDPRDMILSAIDHQNRTKDSRTPVFSQCRSIPSSIPYASHWSQISREWVSNKRAHIFRYADLVRDPEVELHRLCEYLETKVPDRDIHRIIDEEKKSRTYGRNQFNRGITSRFRSEMSQEDIDFCNTQLFSEILGLGYKTWSSTDSSPHGDQILDITSMPEDRLVGFHEPEEWNGVNFRWSQPSAALQLSLPAPPCSLLIDTGRIRGKRCDFHFRIYINANQVPDSSIRIDSGRIEFIIRAEWLKSGSRQTLTITSDPLKVDADDRKLGMPITSLRLVRVQDPFVWEAEHDGWRRSNSGRRRAIAGWQRAITAGHRALAADLPSPTMPLWEIPAWRSFASTEIDNFTDVVVTHTEINSRHGTGVLVQHLFADFSRTVTVVNRQIYGGDQIVSRENLLLENGRRSRTAIYGQVLRWFEKTPPERAYVVPYSMQELQVAIALKDIFQIPVCLHIMDDNNLYTSQIDDEIMRECIDKCDIVFCISKEIIDGYSSKYKSDFYFLPPIVPDDWIPGKSDPLPGEKKNGILLGNVWDDKWLRSLCDMTRGAGIEIDWYSGNHERQLANFDTSILNESGVNIRNPLFDMALVKELRSRAFGIMPSGNLTADERQNIAALSLPSRVVLMMAAAHLPILVLGSPDTAAARFVVDHGIGLVCPYEPTCFRDAVAQITGESTNNKMREAARGMADAFTNKGIKDWIWRSTERGEPVDQRFQSLLN